MGQFFARIFRRPRSRPPQLQTGPPSVGAPPLEAWDWVDQDGTAMVDQDGENLSFGA